MSTRQTGLILYGTCKAVEKLGNDAVNAVGTVNEQTSYHVEGEGWGATLTLTPVGGKVVASLLVTVREVID